MGCGSSKPVRPDAPPARRHIPIDHANDPVATLDFELSTAMLVMPFEHFKKQGRIVKSTKTWRDEALSNGWLVAFEEGTGKVAIFISHTYARALPPLRPASQTLAFNSPSYCYILRR